MATRSKRLREAQRILTDLGMPREQVNERSALTLLALLGLRPDEEWVDATSPLMGITPIMDFARDQYRKKYAPNTRETFRRQTMHQLVAAGIALYNPDNAARPVNSPKAVYQIEPDTLTLLQTFGTAAWNKNRQAYLKKRKTLVARYAMAREMRKIPVKLATGDTMRLSPGAHSELIKAIIEEFSITHNANGCCWSNPSQAMVRWMGSGTRSWHGCLQDQGRVLST